MTTIKFNDRDLCQFEGRNGTFHCTGIAINDYDDYICILPITSRDVMGRCMIDFEMAKIDELISTLQQIKEHHDIQDNRER